MASKTKSAGGGLEGWRPGILLRELVAAGVLLGLLGNLEPQAQGRAVDS